MHNPSSPHPPLTHWRAIAGIDDAWELTRTRGPVPLRAVALRVKDGAVCVYSPVPRSGEAALQELATLGDPILIAPNGYHHLGLREYANAFAMASVVASGRAAPRVGKKSDLHIQSLSVLQAKLPAHISLLQCPRTRNGEVWISIRGEQRRAWIVSDAFLNFRTLPSAPLGLLLKSLRMGPGLSIGATWKWLLKDPAAYRDWLLAAIAEERPTVLVPSHGRAVVDDDLPSRLEQLVRERLD